MRVNVVFALVICVFITFGKGQTPLHLQFILPYSGGWPVGDDVDDGMILAAEDINKNTSLLPGYTITYDIFDDKCDPLLSLGCVANALANTSEGVYAVVGPGCSICSQPVAQLASIYSLPVISWGSTSPALSDKKKFPTFMRVVSSDAIQALGWHAIALNYKWKRVCTLSSQEDLHAILTSTFLNATTASDIEVVTSETFQGSANFDPIIQLDNIKIKGCTIIFLAAYLQDVQNIFYLASQKGMTGPEYVWVGTDAWMFEGFWDTKDNRTQTIKQAAIGCIGTNPAPGSGPKHEDFTARYIARTNKTQYSVYAEFGYDAVFAVANMLHKMIFDLNMTPSPTKAFRQELHDRLLADTYFKGVTPGFVFFDSDGDREMPYAIYYFDSENSLQLSAIWDKPAQTYTLMKQVVWKDGTTNVPDDVLAVTTKLVSLSLRIPILTITCLCLAMTLSFVVSVFMFYEHSRIRAASRVFLLIILFAAILAYIGALILFIQPPSLFTCIAPSILGHFGFAIAFGCLCAKNFRVFRIFTAKLHTHVKLPDEKLMMWVALYLVIYVVYLSVFMALQPPHPLVIPDLTDPKQQYIRCVWDNNVWFTVLYLFEFLSLFFGVFLSYRVRKVELLEFNESSQIGMNNYITMILLLKMLLISGVGLSLH